jgi:hypothetical protein
MTIEFTFKNGVAAVFDLLTDADYLVERALELGELSADCTVEDDNDGVVITMTREVQQHLPAFLARLFDARQTVELTERWKGKGNTRHGSYSLRIVGQPVTVEAEIRLKSDPGGGCTYAITHKAKAQIPLIGRRVEQFILSQAEEGTRKELDHLEARLG